MTIILSAALASLINAQAPVGATVPPAAPPISRPRATPLPVAVDPKVAAIRDAALGDTVAWDITEGLTTEIGPRMTGGSQRQADARDWAVARLKALGFRNVRIEPYTLANVWERGVETAEVVGRHAQPLRLTALGNSGATPPGGLTAPIAYFASLNDLLLAPDGSLKGKIAFVSNVMEATQDGSSYGSSGSARFVGPNVAPIPAAALSVADAENLERLVKLGDPVSIRLTLTPRLIGPRASGNVVAEVPGSDPAAGIVLIGGHLDSWDLGTGAIDDASGVGITTAAARLVMQQGRPRRTIRVVWFGDEEIGGFGGQEYAMAHAGERHAIATESDFGADRVWRFQTNFAGPATAIGDRLAVALAPLGIVRGTDPAGGGTDVGPVLRTGVAGLELEQSGLRYFDYHHTPEDTLDRIDPVQLRQNVAAWAVMLRTVADAPEDIVSVPPRP